MLKRIKAHLSQKQMAVKMGVTIHSIRAWENNDLLPTNAEWQQICSLLSVDPNFLVPKVSH